VSEPCLSKSKHNILAFFEAIHNPMDLSHCCVGKTGLSGSVTESLEVRRACRIQCSVAVHRAVA
jgi:hypothetical protein